MTIGILFVCTANICRSPMAEGVFRTLARRAGLEAAFTIASAGTANLHVGEPPTPAAIEAAARARLRHRATSARARSPRRISRAPTMCWRWIAATWPTCAGWRRATSRPAADVHQVRPHARHPRRPGPVWRHAAGLRAGARSDRGRLQGPARGIDAGSEGESRANRRRVSDAQLPSASRGRPSRPRIGASICSSGHGDLFSTHRCELRLSRACGARRTSPAAAAGFGCSNVVSPISRVHLRAGPLDMARLNVTQPCAAMSKMMPLRSVCLTS